MHDRIVSDYAALLLRVSMGVMFLAHGLILKVLTYTPAGTAKFFESIGYPGITAYGVIAAEILGGLALIAGIKVRLVSLAFVPLMIGATLQHIPNGWMFGFEGGGYEFPAFWTVTLLVQALLGNGAFAAESLLESRSQPTRVPAAA
jgi:putative oxidoreductase